MTDAALALQVARNRAALAQERPGTDQTRWRAEVAELEALCLPPPKKKPASADMSEVARAMAWVASRPLARRVQQGKT